MPGSTTIDYQTLQVAHAIMGNHAFLGAVEDPANSTQLKAAFRGEQVQVNSDLMTAMVELNGLVDGLEACETHIAIDAETAEATAAALKFVNSLGNGFGASLMAQAVARAEAQAFLEPGESGAAALARLQDSFARVERSYSDLAGSGAQQAEALRAQAARFVTDSQTFARQFSTRVDASAYPSRYQLMRETVERMTPQLTELASQSNGLKELKKALSNGHASALRSQGIYLTIVKGKNFGNSLSHAERLRAENLTAMEQQEGLPRPRGPMSYVPIEVQMKNSRYALILVTQVSQKPIQRVYDSINWLAFFEAVAPINSRALANPGAESPQVKQALARVKARKAALITDQVSMAELSVQDLKAVLTLAQRALATVSNHRQSSRNIVAALQTLLDFRRAGQSSEPSSQQVKAIYASHQPVRSFVDLYQTIDWQKVFQRVETMGIHYELYAKRADLLAGKVPSLSRSAIEATYFNLRRSQAQNFDPLLTGSLGALATLTSLSHTHPHADKRPTASQVQSTYDGYLREMKDLEPHFARAQLPQEASLSSFTNALLKEPSKPESWQKLAEALARAGVYTNIDAAIKGLKEGDPRVAELFEAHGLKAEYLGAREQHSEMLRKLEKRSIPRPQARERVSVRK